MYIKSLNFPVQIQVKPSPHCLLTPMQTLSRIPSSRLDAQNQTHIRDFPALYHTCGATSPCYPFVRHRCLLVSHTSVNTFKVQAFIVPTWAEQTRWSMPKCFVICKVLQKGLLGSAKSLIIRRSLNSAELSLCSLESEWDTLLSL